LSIESSNADSLNQLTNTLLLNNKTNKIPLQTTDGYIFLRSQDISYIKSEDIYANVYNGSEKYFVIESLKSLEEILPEKDFFRCHRSYLVNINKVFKLNKKSNYMLILENGTQVPVSRSNKEKVVQKLLEK